MFANTQSELRPRWTPLVTNSLSGALAAATATVLTSPLDLVKTRLQVETQHNGLRAMIRRVWVEEGTKGFYRGMGTSLAALMPNWGLYFGIYSESKSALAKAGYDEGPSVHLASAIIAGMTTDIFMNPLWLVKTRLQTQHMRSKQPMYTGIVNAFETIIRTEGLATLWHGLLPQMLGVMHVAIQFPLYEYLKQILSDRNGGQELGASELILASAAAKVIASISAYPHEVLRSRFQHQHAGDANRYKGLVDVVKRIHKEEGWRGFYSGMGTNMIRVVPSCAITFTIYELVQRYLTTSGF